MFNRLTSRTTGNRAEAAVRRYLQQQGLKFVDNNISSRRGEIDLIFKDNDTLVFIEVRYRKHHQYGNPVETVTYTKQQKIIQAAKHYLHQHQLTDAVNCRFDVIGVSDNIVDHKTSVADKFQYQWIKNAFDG